MVPFNLTPSVIVSGGRWQPALRQGLSPHREVWLHPASCCGELVALLCSGVFPGMLSKAGLWQALSPLIQEESTLGGGWVCGWVMQWLPWEVLEASGLTGLLGLCRLVTGSCAVMWECCKHRLTDQEGQLLWLPQ